MGKDPSNALVVYEKGRSKGSPFEQECCGRLWTKQSDFKRHSATHDPSTRHLCQFEGCGKSFNQKTALKTHMNSHIGARPHKCRMEDCTANFADPSSRGRHEREVHDPSFGYQCKSCLYNTKRREQFAKHWDECIGGVPGKEDYKQAQKAHENAYMELVKQGLRPPPPIRPRVYKPRDGGASPNLARSSPNPTITITPSPQLTVQESTPAKSGPSGNSPNLPSLPNQNYPTASLFPQSQPPANGSLLGLPSPSPTPSHESGTSLFEETGSLRLLSLLDDPNRRMIIHGSPSSRVVSQAPQSVFDYPPPPAPSTIGLDPVAPRPVRDPGQEIPILGHHRYSPYSTRDRLRRWRFPAQDQNRPSTTADAPISPTTMPQWMTSFH
ncbi:C2H2 zinc finger [Ceratobasidium sp. AG-Ba]|nr:C2H2 zinc finger [Ceratobasidium sp. AG-Ba]QRW10369.1 C2H2 zinc finger [Ceratobasidium sp. AG-Ba]